MKILKPIEALANIIDRFTYQGDFPYDFGFDAAQKITFILVLIISWISPIFNGFDIVTFVFGSVIGRIAVMTLLAEKINKIVEKRGGRRSDKPFLWISNPMWKLIVLVILFSILINDLLNQETLGDILLTIPVWLVILIVGFYIFAGITTTVQMPPDPNRVGSPEWKKERGIEQVDHSISNPLWRDKYGNYYRGTRFVPVPAPVTIEVKKK